MKKLARKAMRETLLKQTVDRFSQSTSSGKLEGKEKETAGGNTLRKANTRAL
jgi:hypothetical protein